jgi:hypothetical protein
MKNYHLVEVIQPKDYMTLVKEKLCLSVEEIILSYVFDPKNAHGNKLGIRNEIASLAAKFMNAYTITCGVKYQFHSTKFSDKYKVFHTSWSDCMWNKTECAVCKKEFSNMKKNAFMGLQYYHAEDETQADYTDEWEWGGEICYKCDKKYNIEQFYVCDQDRFINFMHSLCKGETKAERDEIFENYDDFPSDYEEYDE